MRKDEATRKRFIKLRAQGQTYRAIQAELGISRPTIAKWSRLYEKQIDRESKRLDRAREKAWVDWALNERFSVHKLPEG